MTGNQFIESLAITSNQHKQINLAEQLNAALPAATRALLEAVIDATEQYGSTLYLVGGFVRDLLLEHPSLDLDLVIEGDAIPIARDLAKRYGGSVTVYKQFGTATWTIAKAKDRIIEKLTDNAKEVLIPNSLPDALDLVSARHEHYSRAGVLPQVAQDDIRADTYRRDVTVNTLALRLDRGHFGELVDHWDGLEDLRLGRLRVLHDASFKDDATRILRVLRFAVRFNFSIDPHTLDLLKAAREHLEGISGERLRHEFDLILSETRPANVLEKLEKHAVLSAIYPQLHFDSTAASRLALRRDALPASGWNLGSERRRELAYLLWLAYFSPKQAEEVAERLAFSRQLKDSLRILVVLQSEFCQIAEMSPSQLVSKLEQLPLLAVFALYLLVEDPAIQDKLEFFAREWRHVRPRLNGYDLQQRGLPPGPRYRQILEGLRAAWLDGEVSSSEEEIMLLEKWLEND